MAVTTGLNNDVRGWILCFISGAACVFGASVVCVDILVRMLPGQSNFRIQESNAFLACSLSLSFGVMMFSALYSMLPESKDYLKGEHWNDHTAGLLIMACFIGGFLGIQAVSRILHQHMPSHVVDCDHTHKESSLPDDENGHQHHGHIHAHHADAPNSHNSHNSHNSTASARSQPRRARLPSPHAQAHNHTHAPNGHSHDHAEETTPLLAVTKQQATVPWRGRDRARTEDPRRPSMLEVQKRVMSFVKDTKSHCNEEGSCYGYSDPCGQECFKHISYRAVQASRSLTRLRTTMGSIHPPHIITNFDAEHDYADSIVSPRYRTSRATSRDAILRPPVESAHEDDDGLNSNADGHDHVSEAGHNHHDSCAASHAEDVEAQQQHHHHVPNNAFMSIGLQTSIAITLHKLPEGFITYATNHANPELGFNVFMALFVHNITEGFTMCLPLYMALGSRWKAMAWSALLGGMSQPFGAGIAALWFKLANRTNIQPNAVAYACLFAVTSGIMVSVALQLFVEGLSLNHNRNLCMFFGFLGMAILGVSNALFAAH